MSVFTKKVKILSAGVISAFCLTMIPLQAADPNKTSSRPNTSERQKSAGQAGQSSTDQSSAGTASNRSQQLSQERINRERMEAERQARTQPIAEAMTAIEQTQAAVKSIDENNLPKATAALENAIGKIDVLLARQPEMKLVPVSAQVQIIDLIADEDTVKSIAKQARDLMNDGQIQAARKALWNFASEIDLITVNIPLATYRPAIQSAARLLSEGKTQAAQAALVTALNSLVVTERSIPLPLVRAQAWIDEVNRQVNENKINPQEADRLLNDASLQLRLAQEMGYATKDEVDNLQSSIKQLRDDLGEKKEGKGLVTRIKNDLAALKDRIVKRPEKK